MIPSSGGTAALTFGSLGARGAGATLDLSVPSGGSVLFSTAPVSNNGIVGGWATFNGVNWVVPGANGAAATALSSYTPMAATGLSTTANYLSTADLSVTGAESINSLKLAGAQTLTLGGILTVRSGGVLFDNTTGSATVTGGSLGLSASLTGGALNTGSATVTVGICPTVKPCCWPRSTSPSSAWVCPTACWVWLGPPCAHRSVSRWSRRAWSPWC